MKLSRLILLLLGLAGAPALANEGQQVPQVGLEGPDSDACVGIGRISRTNLNLTPDGKLPVYPTPMAYIRAADHLEADTLVWLCEAAGEWQGIVYASGDFQDLGDCRVSTPVTVPQAYAGPCKSGWVAANSLQLVAG